MPSKTSDTVLEDFRTVMPFTSMMASGGFQFWVEYIDRKRITFLVPLS